MKINTNTKLGHYSQRAFQIALRTFMANSPRLATGHDLDGLQGCNGTVYLAEVNDRQYGLDIGDEGTTLFRMDANGNWRHWDFAVTETYCEKD